MYHSSSLRILTCAFAMTLACSALVTFTEDAQACEPPFTAWFVQDTFPVDGEMAAPINGVIAFDLDFVLDAGSARPNAWPDRETFDMTVEREVLRGGTEPVPGTWEYDPNFRQMRFVAERVFAEGVEYTVNITFRNELLNDNDEYPDEDFSLTFTTGNELDEAPPAFSGLQAHILLESAVPERECCEATLEHCFCPGVCTWCWTVGWNYPPSSDLEFRTSPDEFGNNTVAYAIYRVPSDDPADLPDEDTEPLSVIKDAPPTFSLTFLHDLEEEGPFCFFVRAHDIFGRTDSNTNVICRTRDELVDIAREEIPPPDRSNCVEEENNANNTEMDAGMDADDNNTGGNNSETDAGGNNVGGNNANNAGDDVGESTPDAVDEDEEAMPNISSSATKDDGGCFCATPTHDIPQRWSWLAALGAFALIAWRKRRRARPNMR